MARRGDLVILSRRRRVTTLGATDDDAPVAISLGVATSTSRDGVVKAWDSPVMSASEPRSIPLREHRTATIQIAAQDTLDVAAAMSAYRAHTWPASAMIREFASMQECREFLTPFRRQAKTA